MKKRLQGLIVGILLSFIVINTAVYAATGESTVKIVYNNIKVHVDGKEIVPKDGEGKVVEPFIMDGTTYLPIRAVANAFGKDVIWDGATQSVYLGKKNQNKPDNYLDRIQYSDYLTGYPANKFSIMNSKITDFTGTDHTNGLLFRINSSSYAIEGDVDEANTKIVYPLNNQYKKLSGNVVVPKLASNRETSGVTVHFYGDGQLLHTAKSVTGSMPFNFNINISGVNSLEVKIVSHDTYYIALTDLALYE